MGNEHRRRIVTADEDDAYTPWRKALTRYQRAGAVAAVKRDSWRRERREAKAEIALRRIED